MRLTNSASGWGLVARTLHWGMAVLIFAMLGVGVYMARIETDLIAVFQLIQTHKSFGFVVFWLATVRILWRVLGRAAPTPPQMMPDWQRIASRASHLALYGLMLAMPLTGWLMVSASPFNDPGPARIPNTVFGLFEMPDAFAQGSEALTETLQLAHTTCAVLLCLVLCVHVAAALKHHFVDRDAVLRRMLRGSTQGRA